MLLPLGQNKKPVKPSLKRTSSSDADCVFFPAKKNTFIPNTAKTYKQCTKSAKATVTGKTVSVTSKSGGFSLDIGSMLDSSVSLLQVMIFILCPSMT